MEYIVEYRVYMNVKVDAESYDDAIEKANAKFYDAQCSNDFNVIFGEPYYIETDNGNNKKWLD